MPHENIFSKAKQAFLNSRVAGFFVGKRDFTSLGPDAPASRILSGEWVLADSSNVREYRYFPGQERLEINFHNGSLYYYTGVSPRDAVNFDTSSSKGKWVWDNLRVRGNGNAKKTQKPFGRAA